MRIDRRVVLASVAIVLLTVVIAVLGLRLYLGREAEGRLAPEEIIDFAARASVDRTNVFAMCPPGYCTPPGDMTSPVFAMAWERLFDYWREVIAGQRGVKRVAWDAQRRRATYIQRSLVFHFPDIVTVEFVPLGEASSSLAIDSRARYGRGDHGVNRDRVIDWMTALQAMMQHDRQPAE